jgi:hypothetical protein
MATASTVRGGIVTALAGVVTASGLRVYGKWPANINAPACCVRRTGSVQHTTFASNGSMTFDIMVAVQFTDYERAQVDLDGYTDHSGAKSIIAALESSATLSGVIEYMLIGDWGPDDGIAYPENGPEYLAAVLPVECHIRY